MRNEPPNRSAEASRISVVRDLKLVPLMPPARTVARAIRPMQQPWQGILLERHSIGAIEIPEHEHRDFCLHLQLSGSPDMEWWSAGQNRVEQTAPGSIILLGPGTRDRLHWQGSSERLVLSLQPEFIQRIAEEAGAHGVVEMRNRWAARDASLINLLTDMATQAQSGWPLGSLYADLIGASLANVLLHRYTEAQLPPAPRSGKLPLPRLRRAMEFITDNLHRDLRLEEIASDVDLSAFHFARVFRESTGQTPYRYLLDQRIAHAKRLLASINLPVQEIALQTGFSSPTNFVRAFRQRTGATPRAWAAGF